MIVERVEHPGWLSNAYLIADGPGGHGVLIDSNGLTAALEQRAVARRDHDHARPVHARSRRPRRRHRGGRSARRCAAAGASADRGRGGRSASPTATTIASGDLVFRALYTPGHCADHIAFVADDTHCVTADVLFRGTVGGTAGPGGSLAELKHSILEVLLRSPPATVVLPGHREATTIGAERETNPFIRAWLDGEGLSESPCRVSGQDATLLLWADDYDGGHKALVRFPSGEETIVGGSRVER